MTPCGAEGPSDRAAPVNVAVRSPVQVQVTVRAPVNVAVRSPVQVQVTVRALDFDEKTVKCRPRHVERMKLFRAACYEPTATCADFVRAWSMYQYMSSTLAFPRHEYPALQGSYSALAQRLAANPRLWDRVCDQRPDMRLLDTALKRCIDNRPARLVPAPPIKAVVIADASLLAYAAIIVYRDADGATRVELEQHKWTRSEVEHLQLHHSTRSEPEALARVADTIRHRLRVRGASLMLTDHEGFALAFDYGGSPNPFYNERVRRLRARGTDTVLYTPGETNLADKYSRLRAFALLDERGGGSCTEMKATTRTL